MVLKKGDLVEISITDLAYGGKGVGKLDGLVVLIRGGIPGDTLKVKIIRIKKNFAEAEVVEVLKCSDKRIEPRCSHFGLCGGCTWQNLDYEAQLHYKAKAVEDTLKHLGSFSEFVCEKILGSEDVYFYRNKMEYSFGINSAKELIIGLHPFQSFREVFDLEECFLQSELSNQVVHRIRDFCRKENLVPYNIKEQKGFLRYLAIREVKDKTEMMVNLITFYEKFKKAEKFASELMDDFPPIKSVVQNINSRLATIAFGEKEILVGGKGIIQEKIGNLYFNISANSFFQTNSRQAEKLFNKITEYAELDGSEDVLDLYSGTGAISLFLAEKAKRVTGIESVGDSIENARENAELNSINNCRFFQGEVKEVLSSLFQEGYSPEVIVVDPPRAGMHKKVISSILTLKPVKIVYVSCNPATLARDLQILCEEDYRLEKVQPVDMFPQTYHIESVARLIKRN
ncbi:MAG: 23S rRNA (uracil(1939)-C(5))-methyltransferase RlmD [candidate division Zixibacteria bacterium]|nr:23S rRNA (uracil(1939)-C(5))-methyltransferase RlmD [candidate division Zixibacteria bacterium]